MTFVSRNSSKIGHRSFVGLLLFHWKKSGKRQCRTLCFAAKRTRLDTFRMVHKPIPRDRFRPGLKGQKFRTMSRRLETDERKEKKKRASVSVIDCRKRQAKDDAQSEARSIGGLECPPRPRQRLAFGRIPRSSLPDNRNV